MRVSRYALGLVLPMLLPVVFDQPHRMSYPDTKKTIERIKDHGDSFQDNLKDDVERSGVDSQTRYDIKRAVDRFENVAKDLEGRYEKDNAAVPYVQRLLADASYIDAFMSRHMVSPRVQNQWLFLRQDLDLLANSYNLDTGWPSELARTEPPAVVISARARDIIRDIQTNAAAFETHVRGALASSTTAEIQMGAISQYLEEFMSANRLQTASTAEAANEVLVRAELIDRYMKDHPLTISAQESWIRLRSDLVRLAAAYNMAPGWLSR